MVRNEENAIERLLIEDKELRIITQEFLDKWEKEIFMGNPETLESIKEKIEFFQMLLDLVNLPKIVSK